MNLLNIFQTKIKPKHHEPPSPGEIRREIEKLSRCSECHFLIFDNYWSDEIEKVNIKVCPTCGYKL